MVGLLSLEHFPIMNEDTAEMGNGLKGIEYRTYLPSWSLITSDVEGRILLVSLSFFASSIFFMVQEVFWKIQNSKNFLFQMFYVQ